MGNSNKEQFRLLTYQGIQCGSFFWINARLIYDNKLQIAKKSDKFWNNFNATRKRFFAKGVANIEGVLKIGEKQQAFVTDDFGYIKIVSSDWAETNVDTCIWEFGKIDLVIEQKESFLRVNEECKRIIVSDIDDTIVHTNVRHKYRTVFNAIIGNAFTKKPVKGAAQMYQRLTENGRNPIFYASRSPQELYDVIRQFLQINQYPVGPFLLRNISKEWHYKQKDILKEQKFLAIKMVLQNTAQVKSILIGDSSEKDAIIYLHLAEQFPDKVEQIFIRIVQRNNKFISLKKDIERFANHKLVQFFDDFDELKLV